MGITVVALEDAAGPFFQPREDAFPDATAAQWRAADAADPASVGAQGQWWLRFRCFALRLPGGRVVLVDAGVGPVDAPAAAWAPVPGRLPQELAAAGIAPDDVDAVVLTHLHTDHVGWAVVGALPYFGNARYVLQRAEYEAVDALNPQLRERLLTPLQATGQLSLADGDEALAEAVRVVATPGHTPGHQSVLVETGDRLVAVGGDLLVHALQLIHPELPYAIESDPELARRSRTALLGRLTAAGGVLAAPHLGEPFWTATTGGWRGTAGI